jgi:hypothetical protein
MRFSFRFDAMTPDYPVGVHLTLMSARVRGTTCPRPLWALDTAAAPLRCVAAVPIEVPSRAAVRRRRRTGVAQLAQRGQVDSAERMARVKKGGRSGAILLVTNAVLGDPRVGHAEDVGERRAIARPVTSSSPAGAGRHRRYLGSTSTSAATG